MSSAQSVVVKNYLNAALNNISLTDIVKVASTVHLDEVDRIYVSDAPEASKVIYSIDDVLLNDGDRVVIKDQADPFQNGLYRYTLGHYLQRIDDTDDQLPNDTAYVVEQGTTNGGQVFARTLSDAHQFIRLADYIPSASSKVPVQQTVSSREHIQLTIFHSDVAITDNIYIRGGQIADKLFSIVADDDDSYAIRSMNASLDIGVSTDANTNGGIPAISVGLDNSVAISGKLQTLSDVTVLGNLKVRGEFDLQESLTAGRLHLTDTSVVSPGRALDDFGQVIIRGANSSKSGPHLTTFSTADSQPILNISSWSHDDISINLDCAYDGTVCYPSFDTSCQIRKNKGQLEFNYHDNLQGVYRPALSIDLRDGSKFFTGETVFADTDGTFGSIKIAPSIASKESSIAFYTTPNLRNSLATDFWKISVNNTTNTLGFYMNTDIPMLTLTAVDQGQQMWIPNALKVGRDEDFVVDANGITIGQDCQVKKSLSAARLIVSSTDDAAATVQGGLYVSKGLAVNEKIATARMLLSSSTPRLVFHADSDSAGSPQISRMSTGSRIILQRHQSPVTTDMAIGVDAGAVWYSIPGNMAQYAHKWYAGDVAVMTLDGIGNFSLNGFGNAVNFTGLSSAGLGLFGNDVACIVNFADRWTLGQDDIGDFTISKKGATGGDFALLSVSRADNTVRTSNMSVTGKLIAHSISCLTSVSFPLNSVGATGPRIQLTRDGISYGGHSVLTFPDLNLKRSISIKSIDDFPVYINCESTLSAKPRASETIINKNNAGDTSIWFADRKLMHFGPRKAQLSANLSVTGNLSLDGEMTATGISTERLKVSAHVEIDDADSILTLNTKGITTSHGVFSVRGAESLKLSAEREINVLSGRVVNVVSPRVRTGKLSVEGGLTVLSDCIGNLTTREGRLRCNSFETTMYNDRDVDQWLYVGRLNTTSRGEGPGECGCIFLAIDDDTTSGFGRMLCSASVRKGIVTAMHEYEHEHDSDGFDDSERDFTFGSSVCIFRNEDLSSADYGDYHVFVLVRNRCVMNISVSSFVSAVPLTDLHAEGFSTLPNGHVSSFSSTWHRVYSTTSPASSRKRVGSVVYDVGMESKGPAIFRSDAVFAGDVFFDGVVSSNAHGLFSILDGNRKLVASFSSESTLIGGNLMPAETQISLGAGGQMFDQAHVRVVHCRDLFSKSVEANVGIFSDFVQINAMHIAENGTVDGKLFVKGETILDNIVTCQSVNVSGNVVFDGHTLVKNMRAEGDVEMMGCLRAPGTFEIHTSAVQVVNSASGKSVGISTSGKIETSADVKTISLSPGGVDILQVSMDGRVDLLPVDLSSSHLRVSAQTTHFDSDVDFGKSVVFAAPTQFASGITLGHSEYVRVHGRNERMEPSAWNENAILHWEDGLLHLCVPGSYNGIDESWQPTNRLTIDQHGKLYIRGNGIECLGKSVFGQVHGEHAVVTDGILCCAPESMSSNASLVLGRRSDQISHLLLVDGADKISAGMYVDDNGFSLAVMDSGAFNDGRVQLQLKPDGSLLHTGRYAGFEGPVQCASGMNVSGDELIIHGNPSGDNCTVKFSNDTENVATIQLHPTTPTVEGGGQTGMECALAIVNDGGKVILHAAGKRGMTVSEISGNAAFDGAVFVQSGLDLDSVSETNAEGAVGALNLVGGAVIGGNLLVKKGIHLSGNVGPHKVSLSSPRNLTASYALSLPDSLPEQEGSILCCDSAGNLSWGKQNTGFHETLEATTTKKSTMTSSSFFSAKNGTDGQSVPISGLQMRGQRDTIELAVTMVTKMEKRYSAVTLKGLFRSDLGWYVFHDAYGDSVSITFSVEPFTGKVCYETVPVDGWLSTTFAWKDYNYDTTSDARPTVIGYEDVNVPLPEPILKVKSSSITVAEPLPDGTEWSSCLFSSSTLHVSQDRKDHRYSVSTVTIDDAPESENADDRMALHVRKGKVVFGGEVNCTSDTVVDKTLLCKDFIAMDSVQIGAKGSGMQMFLFGKISIGESKNKRTSIHLTFPTALLTTDYCICGNVVSAQSDSVAMYACNFKALRADGCTVDVVRLDADSWSDTSVMVHYQVLF